VLDRYTLSLNFIVLAEALDQWFENLQNYEVTLVSRPCDLNLDQY
jgi:hypothetical protein